MFLDKSFYRLAFFFFFPNLNFHVFVGKHVRGPQAAVPEVIRAGQMLCREVWSLGDGP